MTSPSKSWLALVCPVCGMDFQQKASHQLLCGRLSCRQAWVKMPGPMRRAWTWAVAKMLAAGRAQ